MTTLLSYGNELIDELERQLEAARAKPTIGVVHKMRVQIKKIRALLTFLGQYDETFDEKKIIKKVKKIFKPAGHLREMQLHRKMLKKYRFNGQEAVSFFLKKEKDARRSAEEHLDKALRKFDEEKMRKLRKRWQEAAERAEPEKIEALAHDFTQQRLVAIAGLTNSRPDSEQLHQIRKYLKEILYLQQIMMGAGYSPALSPEAYEKVKSLQEEFGNWHDLQVLHDKLLNTKWKDIDPSELLHAVEADKIMSEVMIIRRLESELEFFLEACGFTA